MKKKLEPIKIRVLGGDEAWMYVNAESIEIFIAGHTENLATTLSAKITRAQLKKLGL